MLLLLPLLVAGERGLLRQKLRAWTAMFGASLLAIGALYLPVSQIAAYIAIDLIAGAIVLRHPAGVAQKAIGLLFVMMVLFHIGFKLAGNPWNMGGYLNAQLVVGWLQLACLFAWGVDDVLGRAYRRYGIARRQAVARRSDR